MISFITLNYGDLDLLNFTLDNVKQYTNDIVIVDIPLFGKTPNSRVSLPWDYLMTHGHSHPYNIGMSLAKYDYTHVIGKGKLIDEFREDTFRFLVSCQVAVMGCGVRNSEYTWHHTGHRDLSKWVGYVHQELQPVNTNIPTPVSDEQVIIWSRPKQERPDTWEEYACAIYRDMARMKWLVAIQRDQTHRYGTTAGWWTWPKHALTQQDFANYDMQKHIISRDKEYFLKECKRMHKNQSYIFTHTW